MARSIAAPAPRRLLRRPANPALGIARPLRAITRSARNGVAFAWERRRPRIALLAALIAMPLLGGGWLWLRHSSLVAVEHVQVRGLVAVHGADAGAIEAALTNAAHKMSTLDVQPAALRAAVAPFPIVRSLRAHASLPHGLRIEVVEQPPVAQIAVDGLHTAVAADGVVLGPGYLTSSLPLVDAGNSASTAAAAVTTPVVGRSVTGAALLQALTVLGAAPPALARALTRVYSGPYGLTVALHGGLLAYFGDATRAHAKWIALVRVLADPSSAGAAYIDVRLPERPAAGFAPGSTRPDASSAESEPSSASDPTTAAELAAGLNAAVAGGSGTSASAGAGASASSGSGTGTGTGTGSSSAAATAAAGEPAPTNNAPATEPGATATATEAGSAGSTESTATG
jgi:cell division protein FtsQ